MVVATYPIAPSVTPLRGTLLDAAEVKDGITWLDGKDLFESYNCMKFDSAADFCAPNTKTFDNTPAWMDGFRFAAYGGVTCKGVGLDRQRMQSEVERVFKAGESTAVEQALMTTRFRADASADALWAAPVDITPVAGPVKPNVGVALLEGYAGSVYVGGATLHVPRTIASLLLGVQAAAVLSGAQFTTKLGSKIAAGVGYDFPNYGPDGTEPAAGEKWLYATGEVFVGRGDAVVHQAIDMGNNDVLVLAERSYIAAVDCFAAAVRVTVE